MNKMKINNRTWTIRERLKYLFDEGHYIEFGVYAENQINKFNYNCNNNISGDGVVAALGKINGKEVIVIAHDSKVLGGSLGITGAKKICDTMDKALSLKIPFISLMDSVGARIEEGVSALNMCAEILKRNVRMSGKIPQISVILGSCVGAASYSAALSDFVFMVKESSNMFLTGPKIIKEMMYSDISAEKLGGADVHSKESGIAHFIYNSEKECLEGVKYLLSFLIVKPLYQKSVIKNVNEELFLNIQKMEQSKSYDMHLIIKEIVDMDAFLEIQKDFAKNIIIGFALLGGGIIGVVANNPYVLGGILDINASVKASRFIRFCDCFHIPILTLVDVPAFMPGREQESNGIIKHGAKLVYAYAESTVVKVTVILRKAFGGAYIAMGSKGLGADIVYSWPMAQTAVMGEKGAFKIIGDKFKNRLYKNNSEKDFLEIYKNFYMSPYEGAKSNMVDDVIKPEKTREILIETFCLLSKKNEYTNFHSNIPL